MHYFTLQLNLTKLNLDRNSSARRIFQSLVVKTLPCPGCFTAYISVHFPIVKLGYSHWMTHCGMAPNGVANSIEFQLMSLHGIEVLACSFDTDFNYSLFWQYFMHGLFYVIREMESVMILQFVEILQFSKVLISLVWTQFKPI